jgi:hypothetical protein
MTTGEHERYELMAKNGATAPEAYREAALAGLGRLRGIRMLRAVFSLSLEEATAISEKYGKEATATTTGADS